ncbi:MAG: hypothetical protein LBJ88_04410 [Campylobacteraceae bacterium]|jgi:hypothetical protein|nr:hypothetical protein [Campylobacteraceae bacterium]
MTIYIFKINTLSDSINFYEKIEKSLEEEIVLDFSFSTFIRNNYLPIIGLSLEYQRKYNKKIKITPPLDYKVQKSMHNIGFLSAFSKEMKQKNISDTMIRYTNIKLEEENKLNTFYNYFSDQLTKRVKNLSPELSNKIIQKIFELFSNVFRHSSSEFGLFCSGQFYPNSNKFYFTIVDGGVTIKTNVNNYLETKFNKSRFQKFEPISGVKAIQWSLERGNSTTGEGGLGLYLLQELILKSKGELEIISNDGYYQIKDGKENLLDFNKVFNGTIISIGFNTDDSSYYSLRSEYD